MAHWAEIDNNNKVLRVTVGDNNEPDEGYQWLIDNLGGTWIKTSYTARGGQKCHPITNEPIGEPGFRKNFAQIDYTYDPIRDAFIPPKPENVDGIEYILNEDTCLWEEIIPE